MFMEKALRDCRLGDTYQFVAELIAPLAEAVAGGTQTCLRSLALDYAASRIRGGFANWPRFSQINAVQPDEQDRQLQRQSRPTGLDIEPIEKHVRFLRATSKLKMTAAAAEHVKSIVLQI